MKIKSSIDWIKFNKIALEKLYWFKQSQNKIFRDKAIEVKNEINKEIS